MTDLNQVLDTLPAFLNFALATLGLARRRIRQAIGSRWRHRPGSFFLPV